MFCCYSHSGLPKIMLQKRPPITVPAPQNVTQATCFKDLPDYAFPMLRHLGCNLASNQRLLVKVNRLAKSFMEKVCLLVRFTFLRGLIHSPNSYTYINLQNFFFVKFVLRKMFLFLPIVFLFSLIFFFNFCFILYWHPVSCKRFTFVSFTFLRGLHL